MSFFCSSTVLNETHMTHTGDCVSFSTLSSRVHALKAQRSYNIIFTNRGKNPDLRCNPGLRISWHSFNVIMCVFMEEYETTLFNASEKLSNHGYEHIVSRVHCIEWILQWLKSLKLH